MLKKLDQLPADQMLVAVIKEWDAWDKDNGWHLRGSKGRRKTGRPSKYYLSRDDHQTLTIRITAFTIDEAIDEANYIIEHQ